MAGGAWGLALGAVLHRLRRGAAEAVLRLFPQGREERLGPAAARAAQRAPSRREVRAALRERVAARAHPVDAVLSGSCQRRIIREKSGFSGKHYVRPDG